MNTCIHQVAFSLAALLFIGCDTNKDAQTKDSANLKMAKLDGLPQSIALNSNQQVLKHQSNTQPNNNFRALIYKSSTQEDRKKIYEIIQNEAQVKGIEDPTKLAAEFVINAGDEHEQIATLALLIRCLPNVESHLSLYSNFPIGKLRSTSAAASTSWLVQEHNLSDLRFFYAKLALGRDRVSVAKNAASLCARTDGFAAAIDLINSFDMEEEKISAISELLSENFTEETSNNPEVNKKIRELLSSFSSRDKEALSHLLNIK